VCVRYPLQVQWLHFVQTVYATHLGLCNGMCHCKIYVTGYVDIVTSVQHVHLISCICSYNTTKLRDVHVYLLYAFMAWCSSTNNQHVYMAKNVMGHM